MWPQTQHYEENQVTQNKNRSTATSQQQVQEQTLKRLFKETFTIFRLLQGVLVVGISRTTRSHVLQSMLLECSSLVQYLQNHQRDARKTIQSESRQLQHVPQRWESIIKYINTWDQRAGGLSCAQVHLPLPGFSSYFLVFCIEVIKLIH